MPTLDEIRAAIEFAASSENLMVCCRAGQSRSAAIAFVIACQRLGPETACQLLDPERHIPNSLIVDLGARLIDDLDVFHLFTEWKTANQDVKLSDHYDEIELEFEKLERQGARNRITSC